MCVWQEGAFPAKAGLLVHAHDHRLHRHCCHRGLRRVSLTLACAARFLVSGLPSVVRVRCPAVARANTLVSW